MRACLSGSPLTLVAEVFSVPTKQFIGYELKIWLPYFIKRHIFRRDIPKPPPIIEKESRSDSEVDETILEK